MLSLNEIIEMRKKRPRSSKSIETSIKIESFIYWNVSILFTLLGLLVNIIYLAKQPALNNLLQQRNFKLCPLLQRLCVVRERLFRNGSRLNLNIAL
jgi:hypothetical protein